MKGRRLACSLLLAATTPGALLGLTACSSSSSSGESDPFVGTWQCMGTAKVTYSMPTTNTLMNSTANSVVITDDGHGNVTLVRSPDADSGAPPCTLHSTLSADGKSLTPDTPESCASIAALTQTVTGGMATIGAGNTTYTNTSTFTIEGTNASGAMVMGTGLNNATCTKM